MTTYKKILFLSVMFFFSLSFSTFAQTDDEGLVLDDLLSDDTFQSATGNEVSVQTVEDKVFDPFHVKTSVAIVAEKKIRNELYKNFRPNSIFWIAKPSPSENTGGIEETLENFMERGSGGDPVVVVSEEARNMQSDAARLQDSEYREILKRGIIKRIEQSIGQDISSMPSSKVPYISIKGKSSFSKYFMEMEKQAEKEGPIFLLPMQHSKKGNGYAEYSIMKYSKIKPDIIRLGEDEDAGPIDFSTINLNDSLFVKVGNHFKAYLGSKVVIIGAPDELGGVSEKELAILSVYFQVTRVWGSNAKKTGDAVQDYLSGRATPTGVSSYEQDPPADNTAEPETNEVAADVEPQAGPEEPAGVFPDSIPPGSLDASQYGFDPKRYGPLYDILEKFCGINLKYSNKGDSDRQYRGPDHWTNVTDCSGLVGHFIDKIADAAGMTSPIPRNWYPDSQWYRSNQTTRITAERPPTDPRDLIKPGDIFVLRREEGKHGHIGMFMGYTPNGQPIIAHSTSGMLKQERAISGKVGTTGTRIEIMPQGYFTDSRWDGIYRLNAMDQMLDKLSS